MNVPVSDELYQQLVDEATETVDDGRIVTTRIQFRVAILKAYQRGFKDGVKHEPRQIHPKGK